MQTAADEMLAPLGREEAAPYYYRYIDRVDPGVGVMRTLEDQLAGIDALYGAVSVEGSLFRYEPGKWSLRQVVSHLCDSERVFVFRVFWFARGFTSELPSFDQDVCTTTSKADEVAWADHLEDLRAARRATLTLFRSLPAEAWSRSGVASGNSVTVRALAYIAAGHMTHHESIVRERYLPGV